MKVFNDLLSIVDSGNNAVLILLDLTAAFDTVDHDILIARLEHWAGVKGAALQWFRSYLTDRTFLVTIDSFSSSVAPVSSGVPQRVKSGANSF